MQIQHNTSQRNKAHTQVTFKVSPTTTRNTGPKMPINNDDVLYDDDTTIYKIIGIQLVTNHCFAR